MNVRLVKFDDCSGLRWSYEDLSSDLRIYRLEYPLYEGCHVSVYLSGDYHAKDKKGHYFGYVNRRFVRQKMSRLVELLHLFEMNVLHTLPCTIVKKINKVIQRNAKRRKDLEGISWKIHIGKFGTFKKSSKSKMNAMAPLNSERFRCEKNFKNSRTVPKKRSNNKVDRDSTREGNYELK